MEIKREYYLDKLIKRQNNGLIKNISFVLPIVNLEEQYDEVVETREQIPVTPLR